MGGPCLRDPISRFSTLSNRLLHASVLLHAAAVPYRGAKLLLPACPAPPGPAADCHRKRRCLSIAAGLAVCGCLRWAVPAAARGQDAEAVAALHLRMDGTQGAGDESSDATRGAKCALAYQGRAAAGTWR